MQRDQTGTTPPHMWRSQFHPSSATNRRPRGSVTPGQLWSWIIALAVVLAIIIAIVWVVLPGSQAQQGEDSATTTEMSDSGSAEGGDAADGAAASTDSSTSN